MPLRIILPRLIHSNAMRVSQLLCSWFTFTNTLSARLLLPQSIDPEPLPSLPILSLWRHHRLQLQLMRHRPIRIIRVLSHSQHRLPCLHKPPHPRNLHWHRIDRVELPVELQLWLLPRQRPVQPVSYWLVVRGQRAEHLSHERRLGCASNHAKPVSMQSRIRWRRIGGWNEPLSRVQSRVLLSRRQYQPLNRLPRQLFLARRILVLRLMPVRPRLPPRRRNLSALQRGPDLHQRPAQHLSRELNRP